MSVRESIASRIWDGLWLTLALIPLAIFWSGRNEIFRPDDETPDGALTAYVGASAIYIAAVAFTTMWLRGPWRHQLPVRGLAFVASIGAAMAFSSIGGVALQSTTLTGLGLELAIVLLVWGSACNAAWIIMWWIAAGIRRWRTSTPGSEVRTIRE